MNEAIKAGDVVRLKSGGPKMTVTDVDTTQQSCRCVWFAGMQVCHDDFRLWTLKLDDGRSMAAWIG